MPKIGTRKRKKLYKNIDLAGVAHRRGAPALVEHARNRLADGVEALHAGEAARRGGGSVDGLGEQAELLREDCMLLCVF